MIPSYTEVAEQRGWKFIQPARPTSVRASTRKPHQGEYKRAVILPDTQIGYRLLGSELVPVHDEAAMGIAMQIVKYVNPDLVVQVGDFLDFPTFSKYEQELAFQSTVQAGIDRGHTFLAEIRANAPHAKIVVLEGNHDKRLIRTVHDHALFLSGITRANKPDEWGAITVPFLLRFPELGVEWVGGYPASGYWINDRLRCEHGSRVSSSTSTARLVADNERVSTIFGHIHRIEIHYKTVNVYDGGRTNFAASFGCLCRIDGAVPSVKGAVLENGEPVEKYENWQQGLGVIEYEDGDSLFNMIPIFINTHAGYVTRYDGKTFIP